MTLTEWTNTIKRECKEAGFETTDYQGFPLIKTPDRFEDKVKVLKLRFSVVNVKTIYAEGVLITPSTVR